MGEQNRSSKKEKKDEIKGGFPLQQMNNEAVEMLPIRLIISLAIIAAIAVLIVVASGNLRTILAEQEVEQQCRLLESSLSTMAGTGGFRDVDVFSAPEGSKRIQTFSLPDSLMYLSFGGDPDPSNTGVLTSGLTEDGAVIFYQVQGGSKKVIWLPKETYKFREGTYVDNTWVIQGDGQSYIIRGGGTTTLVFERVQKNHQVYILIHGNDEIT
jgi:type II secretory pathway pseudopilin PulG